MPNNRAMNQWQPMETAPKDGTQILGIYNNGCGWEYRLIYWDGDKIYPWKCVDGDDDCRWAEGRIDDWMPLPGPPNRARAAIAKAESP